MLEQVLRTAEDIVIFGKSTEDRERLVFAFPFKGDVAKHYYDKSVSNADEAGVEGFNRFWEYDEKTGLIKGSSTFLILRLDKVLRRDGLSIPTVEQARILEQKGRLSNGAYRDYGVAVYSLDEPNKQIAKKLIQEAQGLLPLVIPFKAIDYRTDATFPNGINISLVKNPQEIITGKNARDILNGFHYSGNSGACRVDRDRYGNWYGDCYDFGDSYGNGLVDYVCAEGTRADLEIAYEKILERKYGDKISEIKAQRDKEQKAFLKSLE